MYRTSLVSKEIKEEIQNLCCIVTRPKFEEKIREDNYITKTEMILHIMNLLKDADAETIMCAYNELVIPKDPDWTLSPKEDIDACLCNEEPESLLEYGRNGNFNGTGDYWTRTSYNEFFGITDLNIVEG